MPNELGIAVVVLLSTYWLHSTLLLGVTWMGLRLVREPGPALAESLWKVAAVLPLITAPAQWLGEFSGVPVNLSSEARVDAHPQAALATATQSPVAKTTAQRGSEPREFRPMADPVIVSQTAFPEENADAANRRFASLGNARDAQLDPQAAWVLEEFAFDAQPTGPPAVAATSGAPADQPSDSTPPPEPQASRSASRWGVLIGAICGLLFLAFGGVRLLVQTFVFRRRLADARIVTAGTVRQELDALLRIADIGRPIVLLSSATFAEPVAFGLWRRRIVLPVGIEEKLRPDELRALLAHELAHLARGDAAWLWVGRVLCSCLAFQPWNFVARRQWQRAAEQQCDDWAVAHGAAATALARCLMRIAEWRLARRTPFAPAMAFGGEHSTLTRRVERLLSPPPANNARKTRIRRQLLALAVPALAFVLVWCGPRTAITAHSETSTENMLKVNSVEQSASAPTDANTESQAAVTTVENELDLLHTELHHLEQQVGHLHRLLQSASHDSEVRQIAARLAQRLTALQQSRQVMQATRHRASTPGGQTEPGGRRLRSRIVTH